MKASISMLFGEDGLRIEVRDALSRAGFVDIFLTPEQVCMAFSRLSNTPCKMEIRDLDKIGKKMEHKSFEFEILGEGKESAAIQAAKVCPEGWTPELYFGSQNSFFERDDKRFARCTIRRWVDPDTQS